MTLELSHIDERGQAKMVDVGEKTDSKREALASGYIKLKRETLALIKTNSIAKGDVLGTARIAGIMAAKETSLLIPMCHQILLNAIDIYFNFIENLDNDNYAKVRIIASARCDGKTGVEMEALTAVTVAALTVYDMCKAVDRGMCIEDVKLVKKSGGKSGTWIREADHLYGRLLSVNISEKKGEKKKPVEGLIEIIKNHGINGDAHTGDWHRQISLLGIESFQKMWDKGVQVTSGDFAENLTTCGFELYTLPIGSKIIIGEVTLEVTQIGKECHQHCEIYRQSGDCVMPREGIFAKVLTSGKVAKNDLIEVIVGV